jgi:hypothetical protein
MQRGLRPIFCDPQDHTLLVAEGFNWANVLKCDFLCKSCLIDITRWLMKFGAKRTTPVVWTEIQFKFWHWVSTLQATTPLPGRPIFIPKQDRRTSFMIPSNSGVWKVYLVKVDFPPFWHPFCWFSLREMGQNGISGQVLLRFAPFLLQWYYILKCRRFIYQWHKSGQWVVRCERMAVENRVHATGN